MTMRACVHPHLESVDPCHEGLDHLLVADTGGDHQRGFPTAAKAIDVPPGLEGERWVLGKVVGWDGARVGR